MKTDGEQFLQFAAKTNFRGFEQKFSSLCGELGLGARLTPGELALLRHSAFRATLCNIAFNGLGGCNGHIKPERENHRRGLETQFMLARTALYSSQGWNGLTCTLQRQIELRLLTVRIAEQNLAQ